MPISKLIGGLACLTLLAAACSSSSQLSVDVTVIVSTSQAPSTTAPVTTVLTTTTAAPTTTAPTTSEAPAIVCRGVGTGPESYSLDAGGAVHPVSAYVPSSYVEGTAMPLVLDFHGLGSNGTEQILLTLYESLAESEGFIVLHPTGVSSPTDGKKAWELMQYDFPDVDDLAFANALIDDAVERYCVDETRVYATGMSNGSLFTSRLVCEMGGRIAAAASIAGVTHADNCDPERAVPYIAFHGTDDQVVPFDGSVTSSSLDDGAVPGSDNFFSQVMPDEFAEFAEDAGCDPNPNGQTVSDEVTLYDYVGCRDGVEMRFYEIEGGGHTWPGSPLGIFLEGTLGYTTLDVNATEISWEFFQQYSL